MSDTGLVSAVPDFVALPEKRAWDISLSPWAVELDRRNADNELAFDIAERVACKEKLHDIARDLMGVAKEGRLIMWLRADPERYSAYQAGLQARADGLVMESLDIVDGTDGNPESVPSAKLRSYFRRWLAGKYDRTRFGESEKNVNVGVGVKIVMSRDDVGML